MVVRLLGSRLCKADYRTRSPWLVEGSSGVRAHQGRSRDLCHPAYHPPYIIQASVPLSSPHRVRPAAHDLLSLNISGMIIIDEKSQPMFSGPPPISTGPPPYEDHPPPFTTASKQPPTLDTLSPHILLQIVHGLFPQTPDADRGKVERQRMTLYYLSTSLRLVNRVFYIGEQPLGAPDRDLTRNQSPCTYCGPRISLPTTP